MRHMIVIWSGAIIDIPAGWVLCDGNNDTPDLRDKFLIGAGGGQAPDAEGTSNVTGDAQWPWYSLAFIMKSP